MDALNYLREYAGGFRMPDLSKIWYGQDEVDAGNNESLLIQVRIIIWFSIYNETVEINCVQLSKFISFYIDWALFGQGSGAGLMDWSQG